MTTLTLTNDTENDPYSAFWERMTPDETAAVERRLIESPYWTLSTVPFLSTAGIENFAYIEETEDSWRLYLASGPEDVDLEADHVRLNVLRRGPDCLS